MGLRPIMAAVPSNYREVLYWRLTGNLGRQVALNLLALPLAGGAGLFFAWAAANLGRASHVAVGQGELVALLVGLVLMIVAHELVHGLAMRLYGARPQYGVMWKSLMFYATAPGQAFTRNQYLVVGLAPLVSLSALALMGMAAFAGTPVVALLGICATLNAAGAVGDLWIVATVLRYPAHVWVVDERDGVRIFMPAPAQT
ncbi:MAG: DUF3267 domain-containing protein [Anaerolineales bacterium]